MKNLGVVGLFAVLVLGSAPAFAVTRVFVNNTTTLTLTVRTTQSGHALAGDKWGRRATSVGPGQRAEILWFNRDSGIKSGKEFFFSSEVSAGGRRIVLKQKLRGKTINSRMWQSVEGQPWYDDRRLHNASWRAGSAAVKIQYRAVPAGSEDNVEYTFLPAGGPGSVGRTEWVGTAPSCTAIPADCEARDMDYLRSDTSGDGAACWSGVKVLCAARPYPKANLAGDRADLFRVLNWNIFARPFIVTHDGQRERLRHIPRAIAGIEQGRIDVVVFEEAFLKGEYRATLLDGLKKAGFPHSTKVLDLASDLSNGAVFIASRWPIEREAQHVYTGKNACKGNDCLAAKGVMYARVRKKVGSMKRTYHVFGTHMQAWATKEGDVVRMEQARQLRAFVAKQRIPKSDGVIIAGDLNANWLGKKGFGQREHANAVLKVLSGKMPDRRGSLFANSNPDDNQLVGGDGAASDKGCDGEYRRTRTCRCCPTELLAYIVHATDFRRARSSTYEILRIKTPLAFPVCMTAKMQPHHVEPNSPFCGTTWMIKDLSDHYPVIAEFDFR
jgi:endonuclease/exonuclease/phosphatase family metal-dependent hydrolase